MVVFLMLEMTLSEFLAKHEDYRSVTANPRRCAVLEYDPEHGTILAPVRITEDYVAEFGRSWRGEYLRVTARTHSLGEQAPYFSVTGEIWDSEGWWRNGQDGRLRACGSIHEEILQAYPRLAPLVALHLSDAVTGEPMYAFENGWFHYRQGDVDAAARLLRMPLEQGMDEQAFRELVFDQRRRWSLEADKGRQLILSLSEQERGR